MALGKLQYSITPILQREPKSKNLDNSPHLKELQPDTFRPLEEANLTPIGQYSFFQNLDAGCFDLGNFSGEVVGIDGDMFEAVELSELLLFQKSRHAELDAVQGETKVCPAVGRRALGNNLGADVLHIPIHCFPRIRRFKMKMVNFESHSRLLKNDLRRLYS